MDAIPAGVADPGPPRPHRVPLRLGPLSPVPVSAPRRPPLTLLPGTSAAPKWTARAERSEHFGRRVWCPHSEGTGRARQPGEGAWDPNASSAGRHDGASPGTRTVRASRAGPAPPAGAALRLFLLTTNGGTAVPCLEAMESRGRRGQRPRVHTTQDPQRMQTQEHPFSACPVTSPRREPGVARFRDLRCSCSLSLFTVLNPQVRTECTVIHTHLVNK